MKGHNPLAPAYHVESVWLNPSDFQLYELRSKLNELMGHYALEAMASELNIKAELDMLATGAESYRRFIDQPVASPSRSRQVVMWNDMFNWRDERDKVRINTKFSFEESPARNRTLMMGAVNINSGEMVMVSMPDVEDPPSPTMVPGEITAVHGFVVNPFRFVKGSRLIGHCLETDGKDFRLDQQFIANSLIGVLQGLKAGNQYRR